MKHKVLAGLERAGVLQLVADSGWRRRRLLILCYHGISIDREHEWRPRLYMPAEQLRSRLQMMRDGGYRVLPLIEAIWRLKRGDLPPRSVVLTFDDGGHDFHARALPLLREFDVPATVYLSTYYCVKRAPIFPLMCHYILWLSQGRRVVTRAVTGEEIDLELTGSESIERTFWDLLRFAREEGLPDDAKQDLLARLALVLDLDYESLLASRVLQLMNRQQVLEAANAGIDIQLHTHRHRSPAVEDEYRTELQTNRDLITRMTGSVPRHFCYPSGASSPEFVSWLRAEGIHSAMTCRAALASPADNRLLMPRLLDHSWLTAIEFEAWLSGVGHFTTRRRAELTVAPDSPAAMIALLDRKPEFEASLVHAGH